MKGVIVNQVKHVNSERQENNLLKLYTLDLTHKILKTLTSQSKMSLGGCRNIFEDVLRHWQDHPRCLERRRNVSEDVLRH